jgi:exodeoxyribonuclease VII large subunit
MTEPDHIATVSELTTSIKQLLEARYAAVWVRGEISNFRRQASGHLYFTLKDSGSQLPVVIFRSDAARLRADPREGDQVILHGRLTVYEPRGAYQLTARLLLADGLGDLQRKFAALRSRLEAEGLFAAARKRPIPRLPATVGFVTSPTGAAVRDFISVLHRRGWRGRLLILPARVQGAEAAGEIAGWIRYAGDHGLCDLLVVGRGGGSLEDLWPFNEEEVARAIAACPLPVISAVGHQIDFTLSDFAADLRAETPTAAAETIAGNFSSALESCAACARQLRREATTRLRDRRGHLDLLTASLRQHAPRRRLEHALLRLDELAGKLRHAQHRQLQNCRDRLARPGQRLLRHAPAERLAVARERLRQTGLRLLAASPEAILRRGYAILNRPDGSLVCAAAALAPGDPVHARLRDGTAELLTRSVVCTPACPHPDAAP